MYLFYEKMRFGQLFFIVEHVHWLDFWPKWKLWIIRCWLVYTVEIPQQIYDIYHTTQITVTRMR